MFRSRKQTVGAVLLSILLLAATACSPEGGRQAGEEPEQVAAGQADTPALQVAMVTHAPEGDTFFDIIRAGADAAAAKNNIEYQYSSDNDPGRQATLIQNAIDQGPDGIAVAIPSPEALNPVIRDATEAGIPVVAFNAGADDWQDSGALTFFGQDESLAGQAAGERLTEEGAEKVLCVLQAQGQVQLEARCDGVEEGFEGTTEKIYVTGTDMPAVQSAITSKLQEDADISHVVTLAAPIALAVVDSLEQAGSEAQLVTFDLNAELAGAIESGDVRWAIDQQPYLQGYQAMDALWLYLANQNVLGGGEGVLTGPSFVDDSNIEQVAELARGGTR